MRARRAVLVFVLAIWMVCVCVPLKGVRLKVFRRSCLACTGKLSAQVQFSKPRKGKPQEMKMKEKESLECARSCVVSPNYTCHHEARTNATIPLNAGLGGSRAGGAGLFYATCPESRSHGGRKLPKEAGHCGASRGPTRRPSGALTSWPAGDGTAACNANHRVGSVVMMAPWNDSASRSTDLWSLYSAHLVQRPRALE